MSSNLQALDEFPTFTGEESPQEQIRQLQNYLYIVVEQLKYSLRNLGIENLNQGQWDSMKTETLKGLVADMITAGILKSKDGKTFYLDLDNGVLKMQVTELSVMGKTVQEIADESAAAKADAAVDGLDQQEIWNKLFAGGKVQGFEIKDGKLYINGEFAVITNLIASSIVFGVLSSADGTVKVDLSNNCVTIDGKRNGYKTQIKLSSSGLEGYGENTQGKMEKVFSTLLGVGGLPSGLWNEAWEENTGLSIGTAHGVLDIGTTEAVTQIHGSGIELISAMLGTVVSVGLNGLGILGKGVSWKDNGDGTYTLIGQ